MSRKITLWNIQLLQPYWRDFCSSLHCLFWIFLFLGLCEPLQLPTSHFIGWLLYFNHKQKFLTALILFWIWNLEHIKLKLLAGVQCSLVSLTHYELTLPQCIIAHSHVKSRIHSPSFSFQNLFVINISKSTRVFCAFWNLTMAFGRTGSRSLSVIWNIEWL